MKYFRETSAPASRRTRVQLGGYIRTVLVSIAVVAGITGAIATVEWSSVPGRSREEGALYRLMQMPVRSVMGPRPPKESVPLLSQLIASQPTEELYTLRAMQEEAALDFTAAEADWKKHAEVAKDKTRAQFQRADFYHRRLRPADEVAVLETIGRTATPPSEKLRAIADQSSWQAFERVDTVLRENLRGTASYEANYKGWIARYPEQKLVYARYLQFLLDHKQFESAENLVGDYHARFSDDHVFTVKARALLAYKRSSAEQGLAVYDQEFQPLWPQELVQSYFDLLEQTRSMRKFLDQARGALERDPNDLNAAARLFYYYQRQGRADAAQQTLTLFRARKEERNGKWTPQELYTLARLNEATKNYPEAARNYYALYSSADKDETRGQALAGLVRILLDAPEQNVQLGSGSLAMYRDVATIDAGPGYLNGLLSLVLNSTSPTYMYAQEEQNAVPYFHHVEAAELLRLLDTRYANTPERPALHARMLQTFANYGQDEAVISDGKKFLDAFTSAPEREEVALLVADAFARTKREQDEFKVYDVLLAELARKSDGVPLGLNEPAADHTPEPPKGEVTTDTADESADAEIEEETPAAQKQQSRAFAVHEAAKPTERTGGPRSPEYARVLERFLARLVSLNQVPAALGVLRMEIDRNPDDPGLYERLAQFLDQNRLGAQQEEVYRKAIEKFDGTSWYHKLARFYLRHNRNAEFQRLTEKVVNTFAGSELEKYFADVVHSEGFYAQLNEFAHKRFPHDLIFVRNLLDAKGVSVAEHDALLREHWFEADDLRDRFFEILSRTGKLDAELAALRRGAASDERSDWEAMAQDNPVAARFVGEANFWRSYFEEGAPAIGALAAHFPAEEALGRRASAVYRSLAAFDARNTEMAIAVEENLYKSDPGNRETLARIGDILADRDLLSRAAPYWERMTTIRPGEAQAYLDPATVYWDYFDFDNALAKLREGRTKLNDPTLYSYQAGAIYETKRDYAAAVQEYLKGALAAEGSRSRERLLELARRPSLRSFIDEALVRETSGDRPELSAVQLRVAVLDAQNRKKEVEPELAKIASVSSSLEMLEWIEQRARSASQPDLEQAALERQATVTTEPVRRIELRYAIVRLMERKGDLAFAQRLVESVYHDNPKLLGVVRFTTDFYWRTKQPQRAVDTLMQASNVAYPDLSRQLRFEAARKAAETNEFEQARKVLAQLLADSPRNEQYVAAMAETYARAGDDAGLKNYYLQTLADYRSAQLPVDERKRQISALRRGLIPALARLKDYAGALDQYIEIINNFPDDAALATEAALFAQQHGRQKQLVDYYANTIKQSPKDSHWPVVLARIQTQLEDYPAAIETYSAALRIRPDRVDTHTARAELLDRVMRLDEAAAEYQKLYELNYHDPHWMDKVALIRARQGKTAEVVAALKASQVDGRPEKASNYFEVARRLDGWNMLSEAQEFAQKGVDVAGRDLLARSENQNGAEVYVRIMTRLRRQAEAYERLRKAMGDADSFAASVDVAVTQAEKSGPAAVTNSQWREQVLQTRRSTARTGFQNAMRVMGEVVAVYFTPEEKTAFAAELQKNAATVSQDELATAFIQSARAAGLADLEARWLEQVMKAKGKEGVAFERRLITLQSERMQYKELGAALELYAATDRALRYQVLLEAVHAYRAGGLYDAEIDVLARLGRQGRGQEEQRYLRLLLERRPQQLMQVAATNDGDAAVQMAVEHGTEERALETVRARGARQDPVWSGAYTALTGLYFGDRAAPVGTAFTTVLGDATIGERLGKPVDRKQQLAGTVWFYYGSRYGEWLGLSKSEEAEDYLPAVLEQSPGSAQGYVSVAEHYERHGKADQALQEYIRAMDLAPRRAEIHDSVAVLEWKQNRRDEALAQWRQALELLRRQVNARNVPADFWTTAQRVLKHVGERGALAELRPQADAMLRDYIRYNGTYQSNGLLSAAFAAAGGGQNGVAWLLELAQSAPEQIDVLGVLASAGWIPQNAREPIFVRLIDLQAAHVNSTQMVAREYANTGLRTWQVHYAHYLMDAKQFERALSVLDSLPKLPTPAPEELEIRYRIAVANGTLDRILEHYRVMPEDAPPLTALRMVAQALHVANMKPASRKLQEYVFEQEIATHQLTAANLLGLAEIRLEQNQVPAAMELLRRVTLVVGAPYENLDAAATVLSAAGRHGEAADFCAQQVKATPWDARARVKLAKERLAAKQDETAAHDAAVAVARSQAATYAQRVEAAKLVQDSGQLGSAELDLVAAANVSATTADQPFFYAARLKAAQSATGRERVRLLSAAIKDYPEDEEARPALFSALQSFGNNRLALSAIEPLSNYFLRGQYVLPEISEIAPLTPEVKTALEIEEESSADVGIGYVGEAYASTFSPAAAKARAEDELADADILSRAALTEQVAKAYMAIDDVTNAVLYYRRAFGYLTIASTAGNQAVVKRRKDSAREGLRNTLAKIQRDAQNRARMPMIHAELDQANIVMPKLMGESPVAPAKGKGGTQ